MKAIRWNLISTAAVVAVLGAPGIASADDDDDGDGDTVIVPSQPAPAPAPAPAPQQVEVNIEERQQPAMQPAAGPVYTRPAPGAAEGETESYYAGPSRGMLFTGIGLFAVSYGAAAIVSGTSDEDADDSLIVPIAGPWMSLADRPDCGGDAGVDCDEENTNKVLLVTDGVFQAIGAGLIVGSFLAPEKRTRTEYRTAKGPQVRVFPVTGRSTLGVGALGTF